MKSLLCSKAAEEITKKNDFKFIDIAQKLRKILIFKILICIINDHFLMNDLIIKSLLTIANERSNN